MSHWRRFLLTGLCLTLLGCQETDTAGMPESSSAQTDRQQSGQLTSHIPNKLEPTDERIARLQVPQGFELNVFARGMQNPRMMEVAENGTVYVTQPDAGNVIALRDQNGNGRADGQNIAISGLSGVHGIELQDGVMYLATPRSIYRAPLQADGRLGPPREIVGDLPPGGRHPKRTLAFGPDGMLYVSIGSTCNACLEENPESATIIRMNARGGERKVFARGLRNTIGFDWHPQTGAMWGMDIGSDWVGPDSPPEELNRLLAGGNYGWPWCYGSRQVDGSLAGSPPGSLTAQQYCDRTEPAVLTYQAHSSPIGFTFYRGGQFPDAYRGDAFAALRGSWNRQPAVGYKVVHIRFENGQPVRIDDFVTGFLTDEGYIARVAGVAVAADGSLLISDDTNGIIYRVSYRGE